MDKNISAHKNLMIKLEWQKRPADNILNKTKNAANQTFKNLYEKAKIELDDNGMYNLKMI